MPQRVDDSSIADDEVLWRRIIPGWVHREADGTVRPASFAFIDRLSGEVSIHIASIMIDPAHALRLHPENSLAAIRAGHVRSLGLAIVPDPQPDDPSHALICPSPSQGKARQIAKQAVWVIPPNPR